MVFKKKLLALAVIMFAHLFVGCSLEPTVVSQSRIDYNEVFNRMDNEQLLLKLVRLCYRDTPFFMETASISTSFSFNVDTSVEVSILPHVADSYTIVPGISYGEKPIITYPPLTKGIRLFTKKLFPSIFLACFLAPAAKSAISTCDWHCAVAVSSTIPTDKLTKG